MPVIAEAIHEANLIQSTHPIKLWTALHQIHTHTYTHICMCIYNYSVYTAHAVYIKFFVTEKNIDEFRNILSIPIFRIVIASTKS